MDLIKGFWYLILSGHAYPLRVYRAEEQSPITLISALVYLRQCSTSYFQVASCSNRHSIPEHLRIEFLLNRNLHHSMRLSMHGKRKRSQGTLESELVCPSTSPLTHKNLEILNIELAAELASSTNNHPPPFDIMAHQSHSAHSKTPTTNSTPTTKTQGTSLTNAEHILNLYRFFVDRNKQLPAKLEELVCRLKSSRQCDITPNSKAVHIAKQLNQGLSEGMELHVLMDKLLYRAKWFGDGDLEGEPLITQGRDDQWSDRLPRPDTSKDHDLAAAMEKLGLPKKPKPDMTFGYNDEAFPDGLKARILSLPQDLLVYPKSPWFPYRVVQWKSGKGTVREAE